MTDKEQFELFKMSIKMVLDRESTNDINLSMGRVDDAQKLQILNRYTALQKLWIETNDY